MSQAHDPAAFERAKSAFLEGLAHLQAGRPADAEKSFEASLVHVPGRVSTLINLAATRLALRRPKDALACADQVLAAEPLNDDALLHRAVALRALGRLGDALVAFDAALARRQDWADGWFKRGLCLLDLKRPVEALASLERATTLDPTSAAVWSCRGDLLRDMGQLDEARSAYQQALAHGADRELIAYGLAGLGDGLAPPRAPAGYVQALFDSYADDFDEHLVKVLRYRVPEGLAAPLVQLHPQPFSSALDLGCGTGLCGQLVRPLVQRLVGLDLSPRILDQARARGVYDALLHGEIVEHLATTAERHDLVLAADVFIYLGDLEPVFAALARVMPAGGLFCFSAETEGASDAAGFALQPSLRYAHHETYLRSLAERHGFEPLRMARETVREEQRRPIEGLLVHLRRKA
jgi:predicted TPR repeat methyltransferase